MSILKTYRSVFLVKLFSFSSAGVVLRSVLGVITQKVLAVIVGPEGIALIGNFRNALALFGFGSTLGIDQGVLTNQAALQEQPDSLRKLYSTSLGYGALGSIITGLILFFGAEYWSRYLFKTPDYDYLFIILALTVPFLAFYNICLAVVNGNSDYKKATLTSFTAYALVTVSVLVLVVLYDLSGAFLAIALTPVAHLLTMVLLLRKEVRLFRGISIRFHKIMRSNLFVFIIMAVVAVVLGNVVELELRNHLIKKLNLNEAGYWTSMLSLSNYYLSFMTAVYSLYVLPRFAKIFGLRPFVREVAHIYKIILPVFAILFLAIFLLKVPLIKLLFTKEFLPMQVLFKWQLIGDLVKIVAVVMAYQFIARKLWKTFIITELISLILLYVFGVWFVKIMGLEGIAFAHFLRYTVYLVIVIFAISNYFRNNPASETSQN